MRPSDETPSGEDAGVAVGSKVAPPDEKTTGRIRARVGQARQSVEDAKQKVEGAKQKVEEAAPRIPSLDAGLRSIRSDRALGGSLLAGAMGFRLFLWLVPTALILVGGFGLATTGGGADPSELADDIGLSVYIADSIAAGSTGGSVVALLVGAVALWWGGIGAYKALRTIHQLAWRLPVTPGKAAWKGGLWFTAATLGAVVAGAVVNRIRADAPGVGLVLTVLFVLVYAGAWFGASLALPHPDVPKRALIPGALLFGVGTEVLHLATVLYFAGRIDRASEIYGPLGVAIGLLAWLYVIGRLCVAAPVLNATLLARRLEHDVPGTDP
jgi:uncharacterized BrkB/YihY/UPF0761 family membrane protein